MMHTFHHDFSKNLKILVGNFHSKAKAAAAFGVSRQQLNKYLSGVQSPSVEVLSRISMACSLSSDQLLMKHGDFLQQRQRARTVGDLALELGPILGLVSRGGVIADNTHVHLEGLYEVYYDLSEQSLGIVKSIVAIYMQSGIYVARFLRTKSAPDEFTTVRSPTKPLSYLFVEGDRLHMIGYQSFGQEIPQISFSIMAANTLQFPEILTGAVLLSKNSGARDICTVRAVMKRYSKRACAISLARSCGMVNASDVDLFIMGLLANRYV